MTSPTSPQDRAYEWTPRVCLLLAISAVIIVYFTVPGDPMRRLMVVASYSTLIIIFFFGLMVLVAMATDKINLAKLISEPTGDASMSRFQLLIFTFVIALSFFILVVSAASNGKPEFPEIPNQVLLLLGISATTYGVSKGIQFSDPAGLQPKDNGDGPSKPSAETTPEPKA